MGLLDRIAAGFPGALNRIQRWFGRRSATADAASSAIRIEAREAAHPDGKPIALVAGWFFDGSGAAPRTNVRMQILNRRITGVQEAPPGPEPGEPTAPFSELDLRRCTVLPALVDSHVHLSLSGGLDEDGRRRQRHAPFETACGLIAEHLREHLRHGVICVRDGGDTHGHAARYRSGRIGESSVPVRVFAAGRAFHREGRYGRLIGRPVTKGSGLADCILRDETASDFVKIVNSGLNSLTQFGRRTASQFDLDEMTAAVAAARRRGLTVMVHANGEEPVRIAVQAGCRSIEHGFFMGTDNLERMAHKAVTWVPTAGTMQAYAEHLEQIGRPADVARRTLEHQLGQLRKARELQVAVAIGTDAGSPGVYHGAGVITEMRLVMQAGFSLSEAIRCASLNGAGLAGAGFGLLRPGSPATFVVVAGPPSGLPEALAGAEAVYVDGRPVVAAG